MLALGSFNCTLAMDFVDVPQGFWAYKEIDLLTDEKFISGYPDNKFMPEALVTRAEYASMVIKVLGQENIPIDKIIPNIYQPRIKFDNEAIEDLSKSIKDHGIIQPLILS